MVIFTERACSMVLLAAAAVNEFIREAIQFSHWQWMRAHGTMEITCHEIPCSTYIFIVLMDFHIASVPFSPMYNANTHTHASRQQLHTACQMRMKSTKYTQPPRHLPREQTKCKCYIYQALKMKRIALDKGHTHLWHYLVARGDSCYWNGDDKCEWFFLFWSRLTYTGSEWENKTITINSEWRLHFR